MRTSRLQALCGAAGVAVAVGSASATWSIVIVDTRTGEVAAGSATCLTSINLKDETPVVIVGHGAATAQALLEQSGVTRSDLRQGLLTGLEPQLILDGLAALDTGHQSRQYGLVDTQGRSMTFSGSAASDWAGGILGRIERGEPGPADDIVYAVQGNILTGEGVAMAAVAAIEASDGDVAQMLMDGMIAARVTGGDGRCSCPTGTPTGCGTPPPEPFKSADVGYMIVGRLGDIDASRALYRFPFGGGGMVGFDLNGDGREALLVGDPASNELLPYDYLDESVPGVLAVERSARIPTPVAGFRGLDTGDVTGDGVLDVVGLESGTGAVWVIPGAAGGGLDTGAAGAVPGVADVSDIVLADLDGLGGLDIVALDGATGTLTPIVGGAASALTPGGSLVVPGVRGPIAAGDLDGDGGLDLAMVLQSGGDVQVIKTGPGFMVVGPTIDTQAPAVAMTISDVDDDGADEVVTAESDTNEVASYEQDGTPGQRVTVRFRPESFASGEFVPGVDGEFAVVSSSRVTVLASDGAGGFGEIEFERTGEILQRPTAVDLNGDGLDELAGSITGLTGPRRLMLVANEGGELDEPRGWGAGNYWLTLNIANTQSTDPDPVDTLTTRFDFWRDRFAGRTDAVLSTVSGLPDPLEAGAEATVTVELLAYPGVPITVDTTLDAESSDTGVFDVVSISPVAGGFEVVVRGVAEGSASLRLTATDAVDLPVVLMPVPTINIATVQSNPADVNGDGVVDMADLRAFIELFIARDPGADANGDGRVGPGDVSAFIASYLEASGRGGGRFKNADRGNGRNP